MYLRQSASDRSHISLSRPLEKEPDDKDLQPCHDNHKATFHQRKVEDSPLCTPDGAEIPVLARAEVLLVSRNSGELGAELEDGFFED